MADNKFSAPHGIKTRQIADVKFSEAGYAYVEQLTSGKLKGLIPPYTAEGRPDCTKLPDGILIFNVDNSCLEITLSGAWVSICSPKALGLPSDGSWSDGAVSGINSFITVTDAVDLINEYLAQVIIPALNPASHLGTTDGGTNGVLQSPTFSLGRIASPLTTGSPYHTQGWDTDENRECTNASSLTWQLAADEKITDLQAGKITVKYFTGNNTLLTQEELSLNGSLNPQLSARGYISVSDLTALASKVEGFLSLTVPITALLGSGSGYLRVEVTHEVNDTVYTNRPIEFFKDGSYAPTIASQSVSLTAIPAVKYLSGVKFATNSGTNNPKYTFALSSNDIWSTTYRADPIYVDCAQLGIANFVVSYNSPRVTKAGVPSAYPYVFNQDFVYSEERAITAADFMNPSAVGAYGQIRNLVRDPFGQTQGAYFSPARQPLINMQRGSADNLELFVDEDYRLSESAAEMLELPAISGTGRSAGEYMSDISLLDQPALQVINGALIHPQANFSSCLPDGNPNYISLADVQVGPYIRRFRDRNGAARSNGVFLIQGLSEADRTNKNILVEMRVVGQHVAGEPVQYPGNEGTGWLSLNDGFNAAAFLGDDGDGCFVMTQGYTAPYFEFTLGGFSTALAANRAVEVRVTYKIPGAASRRITRMEIIDWI